ncbi:MAG: restriction endonuclease [Ruminococcus sp.]|nr:restriction endonuclease [Ruminococcus sp.]
MRNIDEISKASIQDDWRGIVFENVEVNYKTKPHCEECSAKTNCEMCKCQKSFTVVIFSFFNKNEFPIYTDFVNSIVAIREDNVQIAQATYSICKSALEKNYSIPNDNTIMPNAKQKRLIVFNNVFDENKISKLDYRGKIYAKYEECNWGYLSYNLHTKELYTNGSLEYVRRINDEYIKRKQDKLLEKPYKLMSELEVLIYKRNQLPTTYKDFVTLTAKIQADIKELEVLNSDNDLYLDDDILKFINAIKPDYIETTFKKVKPIDIRSPKEKVTPEEFEYYVADKFSQIGYETSVTRYVIDGGIDIELKKDNKLYGVQCKYLAPNRYVDTVDMLHFLGALVNMRADGGFFVTTGKFTATGYEIAKRNGITTITTSKE